MTTPNAKPSGKTAQGQEQHTKGPWKVCEREFNDAWFVGRTVYSDHTDTPYRVADTGLLNPNSETDARRIVACINACEDYSTEFLERGGLRELVEALRDLLERVDRNGGLGEYKGGSAFVTGRARALLAKGKAVNRG